MFRASTVPIIRSYQQWYMSYSFRAGVNKLLMMDRRTVRNTVPSWSCSKAVYKPVWHIPLLSVQWINSWWWTDELSETCRVSWQINLCNLCIQLVLLQRNLDTLTGQVITNPAIFIQFYINFVSRMGSPHKQHNLHCHIPYFRVLITMVWRWIF